MTSLSSSTPVPPPKRVLVIRYSQTGQLDAVAEQILAPLRADPGIRVHVETLRPLQPHPFPWPFLTFFDAFPESAHMRPPPLAPLSLKGDENFDLVILPYQVWFLAPSLPITAFLQHPVAARLLNGKPVVTVIACRNMWLLAHEKLKVLLAATGARLIDNVVLTDPGNTFATFITTPVWLLSGRKRGFWGLPDAGLSVAQITGARRFGLALRDALRSDAERGSNPLLAGLGAVIAQPRLYISEKAGTRSFYLWGKLIMAVGKPGSWQRKPLLVLYVLFLLALIVTVVPVSLSLQALFRPLFRGWLTKMKARFEHPSGSATDRSHLYDD
ncbi:dialkylresorcinol condensing enzyme [Variovorax sp. J22G21]|uniref:dialkylrecorsinol condensing enzyme n=1 Tax=Variovorax fucosicus TaxID=3053517 RepID=UPI002575C80B|nr:MULTISPECIES: dialkylrecorsinol condensing enzyme [unclassified Variovorax]MDM0041730.1 dialkylresorcinol condensing enzyme [Variovorax sp. J22R193]MDM0060786.1 dialkylresorcinol condensing enzyme [Variovorax sp. J22G21]